TRGGPLALVLDRGEGHATGRIVRVSDDGDDLVLRRGHEPDDRERELLAKPIALVGAGGARCAARVTGFAELARVQPARPHTDAALWRLAAERDTITVVAELDAAGCAEPRVADEDGTLGAAAEPVEADPDVAAAATTWLRALPRHAALEAAYRADADFDPGRPDSSDGETVDVHQFTLAGHAYVTAELHGGRGCGSFGGTMFAIWQTDGGAARLVVDTDSAPAGYDLAFDADHDGRPELAATGDLAPAVEEQEPDDCGC
ncbi:MAG TPA: hypothetical protein VHE35_35020, partial [Kofleriaceae bacterium]|nr:hypothetical protein [Kofleriaceae bacterium]